MKLNVALFALLDAFILAVIILGFVIAKPVLAQVEATSSDPVVESAAPVEPDESSSTSTSDTAEAATVSSEPAPESAPTSNETTPASSTVTASMDRKILPIRKRPPVCSP
jgi:cell division protein FtsN